MADYPTLDKSWQYNVNQTLTAAGSAFACGQLVLYSIYATLIGFASNPWQVRGSNNGSSASLLALSAAGPGTGWGGPTSVNFSLSNQSWVVLRQTGLPSGTHPEILIASNGNSGTAYSVFFSPSAGFTGGSTTTLPTATDQAGLTGASFGVNGTNQAYNLHGMQSTDGSVTRIFLVYSSVCSLFWSMETAKNPEAGWTTPVLTNFNGTSSTATVITSANYYSAVGMGFITPALSNQQAYCTGETANGQLLTKAISVPDDFNSEYPMMEIGIFSSTAPWRGSLGMFYDMWWGLGSNTFGQQYGGAAAHDFVQFGDMVFPWNGTVVNVT